MTIEDIKGNDMVYFSASWCGPCRVTKPIVEKVNSDRDELLQIVVIDELDDSLQEEIKNEFNIRAVPTTIFFKDGAESNRKTGAFQEVELITLLENNK